MSRKESASTVTVKVLRPLRIKVKVGDGARAAAWRRASAKVRRLARRRPFIADLVVVSTERALDRLLDDDAPTFLSVEKFGGGR